MKRLLAIATRTVGAIVGVALLAGGALLIWAAGTESGLRLVWERVASRLPESIEVEALEGRLRGPLVIRGVTLRTSTLELRVERAELEWRPLELLGGTLVIDRLGMRGVDVIQLPPADEPAAPDQASPLPERIDLPFDVAIASASIEGVRYRSRAEAEALVIERVDLEGAADQERWLIRELAVRGPLFDATARLQLAPHDSYETEGEVDWVLRPGNYPDVRGATRFSGDRQALTIEQRVEAPYRADAKVFVRQPLTALRVDGEATLTVQPAALGIVLPNSTVDAIMSFEGTLERVDLTGRLQLGTEQFDRVEADLRAQYADGALQVESLEVAHPASAGAIEASGRLDLQHGLALDLRSTWAGLQWPLLRAARDSPIVTSEAGVLSLSGTLDDYRLSLEGDLAMRGAPPGKVRLAGTGNSGALAFEQIEIAALRGRIVGRGDLSWRPEIGAAIELTGDALDPGVLASEWPGRLRATVRGEATVDGSDVRARIDRLTVTGELRDRPIELAAQGEYSIETIRVESLSLRAGATRIDASGTAAGQEVALQWRIESPDLDELYPGLAGALTASGKLSGPRLQPRITVDAAGHALRYLDSEIGELELTGDVDLAGQAQSQMRLSVQAARVQGSHIEDVELTAEGNAARHSVALAATSDLGATQIALVGQLANPWQKKFAWTFELDTATYAHDDFAAWQLREPARGRVSAAQAELAQTCWQSGTADLCIAGARHEDRTEAAFSLSELPFAYFTAAFANPVQIEGALGIEGTFEQRSGGLPQLNVQLGSSRGRFVSAESGATEPHALAFGPIEASATMADDRIAAQLSLPFEEHGRLELRAGVGAGAGAPFAERSLDGSLGVEIDELAFVSNLVGSLQDTRGTLGGDVRLSGTIGEPRVTGKLALDDGAATVRAANVVLEDLGVLIASDGSNEITVEADARSGGGSVQARGSLALARNGPEGRIAVTGEAFEVVDTQDAQVLVSPDLALALEPDRLSLTGTVRVPSARLTPREAQQSVVSASADQVIVDDEGENGRRFTRPWHADVMLELGDAVRLEGYGLTGRLGGGIKIVELPGEPITGSGELRIQNGVYEAYGQKLEVARGRLLFVGGPIEQPGLDVEAVRRPAESILVGARVRGTLKSPELTVFSEPTMPQQEQLSYLILGRPLQSASDSESSAMSRAALALGLKGGNFVSERVNENLGLDEFGIQTDPGESAAQASFVIGKYLSPSLYVSYGIGLFEPVNTLKLRYTITKRWQLVTESSSEASSGDLIYNIERK
jgi:translocation and assembly module TamB